MTEAWEWDGGSFFFACLLHSFLLASPVRAGKLFFFPKQKLAFEEVRFGESAPNKMDNIFGIMKNRSWSCVFIRDQVLRVYLSIWFCFFSGPSPFMFFFPKMHAWVRGAERGPWHDHFFLLLASLLFPEVDWREGNRDPTKEGRDWRSYPPPLLSIKDISFLYRFGSMDVESRSVHQSISWSLYGLSYKKSKKNHLPHIHTHTHDM